MVLRNAIKDIAAKVGRPGESLVTEEATKNALILPFIQALGYDVFDPAEVVPEFTADFGVKTGEKVDYAIKRDGELVMLVECKRAGAPLGSGQITQLARYFAFTAARFGVLTDGVLYKFFSDLDAANIMDAQPFWEINLGQATERDTLMLDHFTKQSFVLGEAHAAAADLKRIAGMKAYLSLMLNQPDEEFVRLLAGRVFPDPLEEPRVAHFTNLAKAALGEFVNDPTRRGEGQGSDGGAEEASGLPWRGVPVPPAEELEAYELVKTLLDGCVAPHRVVLRGHRTYRSILLDDNRLKTICRMDFTRPRKRFTVFHEGKEERGFRARTEYTVETVGDIANHAGALRDMVTAYLAGAG